MKGSVGAARNVHYRLAADDTWSQVGRHHTPNDAQRQLYEWVGGHTVAVARLTQSR